MRKKLLILVKIAVSIVVIVFLYERISNDFQGFISAFNIYTQNIFIILLVSILMPINWLMEVLKWKYSLKPITKISISEASVGVFSGIALGFITPHAIGDYFAKVFSISHENRKSALGLILISRMLQMLPTLLFGLIAVYFISDFSLSEFDFSYSSSFALSSIIGFVIFGFFLLLYFNRNHPRVKDYLWPIKKLGLKLFVLLSALSIVRYLIFSLQFLILLSVLELQINLFHQFMGIAFMFLIKSILPTFNFLNDLGIREVSIAFFFEKLEVSVAPIIAAGLILWLINIAVPAAIGLFYIPKLKLIYKK
ncbi:lysylphosphatidylglycerol synthase domain-containing protein [Marivirga arenosa]|uniref:Lysylphosphatidylglycerol synthase domain-containing protein n=1 Tax=Marivirga arenosa TaxID=3059076 RepID=A0AA51N5Q9_9BACT|nr:lysylphosphatidylglycerol synthase domain-containing protein [Marivirga sp. ABR2-2]WMN06684.1 lysylphosphatidylglycerol synthase domain-containing protein [Marivirga sp. ABR2-2]